MLWVSTKNESEQWHLAWQDWECRECIVLTNCIFTRLLQFLKMGGYHLKGKSEFLEICPVFLGVIQIVLSQGFLGSSLGIFSGWISKHMPTDLFHWQSLEILISFVCIIISLWGGFFFLFFCFVSISFLLVKTLCWNTRTWNTEKYSFHSPIVTCHWSCNGLSWQKRNHVFGQSS